jgi:multisubunit Na+/H+ antiporter MnhG subunit
VTVALVTVFALLVAYALYAIIRAAVRDGVVAARRQLEAEQRRSAIVRE